MKTIILSFILTISGFISAHAAKYSQHNFMIGEIRNIMAADSDSVKIDRNATVVSYGNKLYQMGIMIGSFDKKSNISKGQLTTRVQIYDLSGKAVAEAVAAGVNASFAITIFAGNEKLSMNLNFDHEAEELALKLRQLGKL